MKPKDNLLILFEELGGDASKITLMKRAGKASVCADANEHQLAVENWHNQSLSKSEKVHQASAVLECAPGQSISTIEFASFGTPSGTCGSFHKGTCHAPNSQAILEKVIIPISMHYCIICKPTTVKIIEWIFQTINVAELLRAGEMLGPHIEQLLWDRPMS